MGAATGSFDGFIVGLDDGLDVGLEVGLESGTDDGPGAGCELGNTVDGVAPSDIILNGRNAFALSP